MTSDGSQTSCCSANTLGARVSNDGRYVVFHSGAGDVVPNDTNGTADVFLRDRQTGETIAASSDPQGTIRDSTSRYPDISGDGRFVTFSSWAKNLVPSDVNNRSDIFVRDLATGNVRRASLDTTGSDPDNHSYSPAISDDGRWLAFESDASDLVAGDTNGWRDVFRYGAIPRDPAPDVKVNGVDGPVTLGTGVPATVSISLDAGDLLGQPFDWWVWAETPWGDFWLLPSLAWVPSVAPMSVLQGGAFSFSGFPVLSGALLPPATYRIHFVLDAPDGAYHGTLQDTVELTVQ